MSDTILLGLSAAIGRASMFCFRLVGMRRLGQEDYGAFALLSSLFVALLPLSHLNLGTSIVYLVSSGKVHPRAGLRRCLAIIWPMSLGTGILLYVLLPTQVLTRIPIWVVILAPVGFLVASLSTLVEGEMRGIHRVRAAGLVTALMGLGRVLPLLICTATGHWAEGVYLSFLLGPIVACIPALGIPQNVVGNRHAGSSSFSLPSALRFSVPVAFTNLVAASLFYISRLSVLHMGLEEVAALDLALLVFGVLQLTLAASSSALLPRIASGESLSLTRPIIVSSLAALLYFILSTTTNLDVLVLRLLRLPEYDESLRLTRTLVLASPALVVFTLRSTELQALGAALPVAAVVACAALVHTPLSLFMAHQQGAEGAVLSCVITLTVLALALSWLRRLGVGRWKA